MCKITLNDLIKNLQEHVKNDHKGGAQVFVIIEGKSYPIELGGVSTFGDIVSIFVK